MAGECGKSLVPLKSVPQVPAVRQANTPEVRPTRSVKDGYLRMFK